MEYIFFSVVVCLTEVETKEVQADQGKVLEYSIPYKFGHPIIRIAFPKFGHPVAAICILRKE